MRRPKRNMVFRSSQNCNPCMHSRIWSEWRKHSSGGRGFIRQQNSSGKSSLVFFDERSKMYTLNEKCFENSTLRNPPGILSSQSKLKPKCTWTHFLKVWWTLHNCAGDNTNGNLMRAKWRMLFKVRVVLYDAKIWISFSFSCTPVKRRNCMHGFESKSQKCLAPWQHRVFLRNCSIFLPFFWWGLLPMKTTAS